MRGLWERLDTLQAIVDTAQAGDLEQQPEKVRTRYEPYAQAYFVIEAVKRVERQLIENLRDGRSVVGYLSADYGYGKTATAVYLWKRCLDNEIVAVPPFLFRQLGDVMTAAKGWLAYHLSQTQPDLLSKLEDVYTTHAGQSMDELAGTIAERQRIPKEKALSIVREHIANKRDVTTAQSLLAFLRDATSLAQQAGFKGLVVFADETQEFLRMEEAARDAIQSLSELVKGIRGMTSTPLGLMLAMPVQPTEAAVEEQAGDIMQRMRERGTALQLQDAYGRGFPRDLWEHLCALSNDESAKQAVDDETLEAIGQLCERKDLSNGPRTVINAFKRIAQHYQQSRRRYTPVDLMDDYLQGHIVFEGRDAKLTGTLRHLLELPIVQANPQRQRAVKLLAAFPRGVDEGKAGDLYQTIEDLADRERWLGEHITQLSEGYALVGIQEQVGPRPVLDEIIRDFRRRWHQIYSEDRKKQIAVVGFIQDILPMLFPQRGQGRYTDFTGHMRKASELEKDSYGVPYEVLEGCFERLFGKFPNRKVCISIGIDGDSLSRFRPPEEGIDLDFRFLLEFPSDGSADNTPTRIESANRDRRVDFRLNLKRTFGRQFPAELGFLRDIMAPERTSAQVLIGLSMRMWGWLEEHPETSESDRQMIESHRRALHRYALQLLLPDAEDATKVEARGVKASGAGERLVESVFEAKCAELYPAYKPLMVTKEWRNYLRHYRDAMGKRPLAERRGRQRFEDSKDAVAKAFGWSHTVFESNSETLRTMGVLDFHWGGGRGADSEAWVVFQEHPLEALLRETLQREGRQRKVSVGGRDKPVKCLEVSCLTKAARQQGYLGEEVDEALELLRLRQYLERQGDGTVREFAGALDAQELTLEADKLEERFQKLNEHFPGELATMAQLLQNAREHLTADADEVELDVAQRGLQDIRSRLEQFIEGKKRELANTLAGLSEELERRRSQLEPRELEQQVTGSVECVGHVENQRKALRKEFQRLKQEWEELRERARQLQQQARAAIDGETLCRVVDKHRELASLKSKIEKGLEDLQSYLYGLQQWREVVAKATSLHKRLDLGSPFIQQLEDVTTSIMEDFAERGLEALLDWERFKADVETMWGELEAQEGRQRDEFFSHKTHYEDRLGHLMPERMLQATFDPKDPQQSYQVLHQGVLQKLQCWLADRRESVQRALNDADYLTRERGVEASGEQGIAEQILKELEEAQADLDRELVEDLERFDGYCGRLDEIGERLKDVQDKLARKRTEKKPPTDEEAALLQTMTGQRSSLADLRRQLPSDRATVDYLFEMLKGLYRKGHIEVEVRKRD